MDLNFNFYGREGTLDFLRKRVDGLKEGYRQNIAFLGSQFIGKSSTVRQFLSELDDKDIVPIYLDLENKDFHYFFYKFVTTLLYNYSKSQNLPLQEDINVLLETTSEFIPQTVIEIKKIKKCLKEQKISDAYRMLISLPDIFSHESGKFCILIIDEFQNIDEMGIQEAFQDLGKKIMTQKKCLYVVISSFEPFAKKILNEKLSLLFGNFEVVNIGPFDSKTSQSFIKDRLNDIEVGMQLCSFVTNFTGGHPLYLHLICQELVNLSAIHRQREVYMPIVTQAVENIIFDRWGVLSRHFELRINHFLIGKGNRVIADILISLSNEKHKINDLMEDVDIKQGVLKLKLAKLMETGIVVKNGNYYYIQDKLMKYWIKYVFQVRLKALELSEKKQRRNFREELYSVVESFNAFSRKDLSSVVIDLFNCFKNETFSINGRKYKLSYFDEVKPLKLRTSSGNHFDVIKASSGDGDWFIVLRHEALGENDVNTFLKESKKLDQRPQRCLIISLSELDANARLRALQERVWIWNESELNTLLNLYNKPFIVQ